MGHTKRGASLIKQVNDALLAKIAVGQSKHMDKQDNATADKIYSYSTLHSYLKHCCYFAKWCKEVHNCKTLTECQTHINAWLDTRANLSPYTRKLDVAAISKLYGMTAKDLQPTPSRHRANIKRSRGKVVRDKHFSETRNADLVVFCRCTGLRRSEITHLCGDQLYIDDNGDAYIMVKGKGGRKRLAPIIGTDEQKAAIIARMRKAGSNRVWEYVPNGADIHGYRADYAVAIYMMFARDVNSLPRSSLWICKKDRRGLRLDKDAMRAASNALGHNRISVIAGHYLYGLDDETKDI